MNISVTLLGGEYPRHFILSGRIGQTFHRLHLTGKKGITPLESPALRLAAHVHSLRELGFIIETEREPHGGAYPGYHARYTLVSSVSLEAAL
jgi:hypothetical protein